MPRGKVKRVIDGDTFELRSGERVRIAGLNAPELTEKGGQAANAHHEFTHQRVRTCCASGCDRGWARRGASHRCDPQDHVPDDAEYDGPYERRWVQPPGDVTANDGGLRRSPRERKAGRMSEWLMNRNLPVFPILLIIAGAATILRLFLGRRQA